MNDPAPKKQPKRHRSRLKVARYSDDEAAAFDELAKQAGLSDSAFIRVSTIGEMGRPRSRRAPPTEADRQKAQHITAINRVGNLFNQGIAAVHEIRLSAPAATERDRLAYELEALRKLFEKGLGELSAALAVAARDDVREG
jgi:hypothetical protein